MINNDTYWNGRYLNKTDFWDVGSCVPAIADYALQFIPKEAKILIPGCGVAYEGEFLHLQDYLEVFLLDFAEISKKIFLDRVPHFKEQKFITGNFFEHSGQYDFIIEHTFFCALTPDLRNSYAEKMNSLLVPGGKLIGVLFTDTQSEEGPPFGGTIAEYKRLFNIFFETVSIMDNKLSIPPRKGREVFIEFTKSH